MKPERKLLAGRIELIRAIQAAEKYSYLNEEPKKVLLEAIEKIRKDEEGQFLSRSQDCPEKVSYATKKQHEAQNNGRTKTSLGRYFRRQLKVTKAEINDQLLEQFCNKVFAFLVEDSMFTILKGRDIIKTYTDAIGGTSCMTGCCSKFTHIYADNPEVVSIVVFKSSAYSARALLWKTEEGKQVLDRIYPNSGPPVEAFHRWCARKNIRMRKHNSLPNGDVRFQRGGQHFITLKFKKRVMPYMDSFHYGTYVKGEKNTLRLSNFQNFGNLRFNSSTGYMPKPCYHCEERRARLVHKGHEYCHTCYHDLFQQCGRCGVYESANTFTRVLCHNWGGRPSVYFWCSKCQKGYASQCSNCNTWVDERLTHLTKDTKNTFCKSCFNNVTERCEECEAGFEKEQLQDVPDHGRLCGECCCYCKGCNTWLARWRYSKSDGICFECLGELKQQEKDEEYEEEADAQGEAIEIISIAGAM